MTGAPTAVLGVETSCDETAAAVVEEGLRVRSSVVSSQVELHARFGGVVPEVAGRAHVEALVPVVAAALEAAGATGSDLAAVAVTVGPGLIGSLLVGVSAAKALALGWWVPLVGVNHLEGHLYAASLDEGELRFPLVTLLVSGGHTMLVLVEAEGRYRLLAETADDAAGEAFDKVARALGLGYPGGPAVERAAAGGNPEAVRFPRPLLDHGLAMSFSGLKTAVVRYLGTHPDAEPADVAAAFQAAVVEVLVTKARRAAEQTGVDTLCLAGGVAANGPLRAAAQEMGRAAGLRVLLPSRAMCTDNAAMIAAAGWWRLRIDGPSALSTPARANLPLAAAGRV